VLVGLGCVVLGWGGLGQMVLALAWLAWGRLAFSAVVLYVLHCKNLSFSAR
jgi:hypothetical protein